MTRLFFKQTPEVINIQHFLDKYLSVIDAKVTLIENKAFQTLYKAILNENKERFYNEIPYYTPDSRKKTVLRRAR